MMETHVQDRFSDYWEGNLDESARSEVAAHLKECHACASEYEAFQRAMAPLGKLHRMAPTVDLPRTVPDLIHRRSRGRFFAPRRGLRLEWLSLGMLAVVALVYLLLQLMHPGLRVP